MIEGKVKALFSDKERTELLFPITKTSAITNDDGVGLDAIISDTVYSDTNAIKATAVPVNADTLGGKPADEFATQNYVAAEIAKAQLDGGDVDLSGFATKDDVSNAVNGINHPVDSVNGKTGIVQLSADDIGAAPASHVNDKNNPHGVTPAQIGAAPSGYGYGEPCVSFYHTGDDSIANFESALDAVIAGMKNKEAKQICVTCTGITNTTLYGTIYRHEEQYVVVTLTTYYQNGSVVKCKFNGVWEAHGWNNPPMELGKEYRTTERNGGSTVYVKRIAYKLGAINASGASVDSIIPHGISDFAYLVRTHCVKDSYVLPYLKSDGGFTL